MMKSWYSSPEIAALGLRDLPTTAQGVNRLAKVEFWADRKDASGQPLARRRQGRGGGIEYSYRLFPSTSQNQLLARHATQAVGPKTKKATQEKIARDSAWEIYARATEKQKEKAEFRARVLRDVVALQRGGSQKDVAINFVSRREGRGASVQSIYGWFRLVQGVDQADWVAYLLPSQGGGNKKAACSSAAWEYFKGKYLVQSQPSLQICWEKTRIAAEKHGWDWPSAKTIQRRIETELTKAELTLMRKGPKALARLHPPQRRDRTGLHAMEALNADGHKLDVMVRWPDGDVGRPMMVALQDLYSNKILAWRIAKSENSDLVRLCLADVFRTYGIPEKMLFDNGRAFASKQITGGTPNRYRFKVKEGELLGILPMLGVEQTWATPEHGQAKPIERSFKDLTDIISKDSQWDGAYTGNNPTAKPENYGNRAIPIDEFREGVEQGVRFFNARPKRDTKVCGGTRSFDEAFLESFQNSLVRTATPEQIRMCLLSSQSVKPNNQNGLIMLHGNRYWDEKLLDYMGENVTIRFDPDRLHDGIDVYLANGAFLIHAECMEDTGFFDTQSARESKAKINRFKKLTREAAKLQRGMSDDEIARATPKFEEPDFGGPAVPQLVHVNTGSAAVAKAQPEAEEDVDFFKNFGEGLRLVESSREE